jgi:tRNA A-37 threonylcarbamoyl transferase component Bud32
MIADSNRCASCGALQPANAPEGLCPRCLPRQAMTALTPSPADVDATTSPAATCSSYSHETAPADSEITEAHTAEPLTEAASSRTHGTGEWTPEPTENADGNPATRDVPRGTAVRFFGDYEIQKELGRGGMGVVYKARQITLNRPVALKMIKAGVLANDAELRRFQNEAEAVALLDHSGIVPVYEVGEYDGQKYFSMKLIDGSNLAEQLASFQDNPRASVTLMIETAEAVQHANMRGILHRDLKPANILIDAKGHPHITDFGLAKRMESDVEMTASGAIMGTPAYMSPEQADGRRGAMTLATDVYGLGAIFYALLTGKAPFGGLSAIDTLDAVRSHPPEPPSKRSANIPRDLELICLKCLEKKPADRYPTAGTLADDLRRFASGEPVSVRAAGAVERVAKWARRKPTVAAAYALGLLVLLLGGLGGAAVWQWRAAARARDVAATAKDAAERARDGEATAKEATEQLNVQLRRALDEQKQLADQLKRLAKEKTTLAEHAGTSRDRLVAMINDLVTEVNSDPNGTLSQAVLTRKLNEVSEKTKIEFKRVVEMFGMIGD